MSDAETKYSFRRPYPDVLMRERAQRVQLEARRDGELQAPTIAGSSFSLIGPDSVFEINAQPITVVDNVATYDITALELPDTLALSELYQERWILVMPDTTTRTVRREAAVTRFLIHPNMAQEDIVEGEYPNLLSQLADENLSIQNFIDSAWDRLLRLLWASGQWPDLMLTSSAFIEPHREMTLYLIMKHFFRNVPGNNRWETLMNLHKTQMEGAFSRMTSRRDYDQDGLPDERRREAASTLIHRSTGQFRRLRRSPRW